MEQEDRVTKSEAKLTRGCLNFFRMWPVYPSLMLLSVNYINLISSPVQPLTIPIPTPNNPATAVAPARGRGSWMCSASARAARVRPQAQGPPRAPLVLLFPQLLRLSEVACTSTAWAQRGHRSLVTRRGVAKRGGVRIRRRQPRVHLF